MPALNRIELGPTLRDDGRERFTTLALSLRRSARHSEVEDAVKVAPVDQLTSRLVPLERLLLSPRIKSYERPARLINWTPFTSNRDGFNGRR